MSDRSTKLFLEQFEASKKSIESWPDWMRDSARMASASMPLNVETDVKKVRAELPVLPEDSERLS